MKIIELLKKELIGETIIVYKYNNTGLVKIEYKVGRYHKKDEEDEEYPINLLETIQLKILNIHNQEFSSDILIEGNHNGEELLFGVEMYDDIKIMNNENNRPT